MFYFKAETIDNPNPAIIEKAIRSYSLKRLTSLDFKSSESYIIEDEKYFLGLENEHQVLLTRLRTPLERFLPKLIIRFKKNDGFTSYQIRFSLASTLFIFAALVGLVINVSSLLNGDASLESVLFLALAVVLFFVFTFVEIAITKKRINKAILQTSAKEFLNI